MLLTLEKSSLYFNSQPHKEADFCADSNHLLHLYFNSQPHKEADKFPFHFYPPSYYFNSQPHKEADASLCFFVLH